MPPMPYPDWRRQATSRVIGGRSNAWTTSINRGVQVKYCAAI
jgi:hypothetical protein